MIFLLSTHRLVASTPLLAFRLYFPRLLQLSSLRRRRTVRSSRGVDTHYALGAIRTTRSVRYALRARCDTHYALGAIRTMRCLRATDESHIHAMSVRSPMSDIAVINHSDCKHLYAWVTHRISHSDVRSWEPRYWSHKFLGMMHHTAHV